MNASSWDDVPAQLDNPSLNKTVFQNDTDTFMGICAGRYSNECSFAASYIPFRYFQISSAAIKKFDSNHLLLSARFSDLPMSVLQVIKLNNYSF